VTSADEHAPITIVPERSGGAHFPCLDAYRGIGMTMVLLNHAAYATGFILRDTPLAQALSPLIARLDISVPMFFVMSAFLLYRPFVKSALSDRPPLPTRTFYRRRALRLLPAYWFALVVLGIVVGLNIATAFGWISNAFFLLAIGVPAEVCDASGQCHVAYGITQAWSLGVEATFYLALPLYGSLMARLGRSRSLGQRVVVQLAGLAAVYAIGTAFRAFVVLTDPSWAEQSLLWLPMFLDLFALGMALAVISAALSAGQVLPRAGQWLADHPITCWVIAGLIFLAVTRMPYPAQPFGLRDTTGYSDYLPRQFAYGVASVIWLWPAIFGDQTKGVLRRALSSRPLVYLGAISLSFYLWHLVIIEKVKEWTTPGYDLILERARNPRPGNTLDAVGTFTGSYLKVAAISWVLSFLVATVLFRLVELPFLRLKDQPLASVFRRPTASSGE
jgi:peptidoglycan/LPS O-acetylase OafA/YrhL